MRELPPPSFDFSPQGWVKGDIFTCSYDVQGAFINLCAFYWMRGGDMTITQAHSRIPDHLVEELVKEDIIQFVGARVKIKFLDEQLHPPPRKKMIRTKPPKNVSKSSDCGGVLYTPVLDLEIGTKKIKKEKENDKRKTKETKRVRFTSQVNELGEQYKTTMLKDFIDYWTETKPNGFTMRWEMQPTFDIIRRLATWKRNETKFNPGKKSMGSRSGQYGGYNYKRPKE